MSPPEARPDPTEVERRIRAVVELLVRHGADAAVLRARRNVSWLTVGAQAHVVQATDEAAAAAVIERDGARIVAPVNEAARLRDEELTGLPLDVVEHPWTAPPPEPRGRVLTDGDLEPELVERRVQLTRLEQDRLAWIGSRLSAALDDTASEVVRGMRETDVAAALLARLTADDLRAPVLLVGADARIARYRHPLPTAASVLNRVMLVAVAERWGLHVALTRIVELGPADDDLARRTEAVERVHAAMLAMTRPGSTIGEVFAAAQQAYAAAGFPEEWRLHHQGGLLGYRPRERVATPGDETVLRAGMAVAWNPSIAGAKVEGSYLLTEGDGPLVPLTTSPSTHVV